MAGQPISIAVNNSTTASLADAESQIFATGIPGVFIEPNEAYNYNIFEELG